MIGLGRMGMGIGVGFELAPISPAIERLVGAIQATDGCMHLLEEALATMLAADDHLPHDPDAAVSELEQGIARLRYALGHGEEPAL
jgi:hypothetical protein